ncbi:hypothetical protein P7K49_022897 [Saguinus oedipus]|uniref:Uncharacterized protein n=1 Tax=Saguinus oedipus TaxID=9490 RepID=A0ABQ9UKR1_SAGOE|nr:hypothetical protein P7K49_022897 [Saguinus oedipus]
MAENLLDGPPNPKRAKLSSPGFSANDSTAGSRGAVTPIRKRTDRAGSPEQVRQPVPLAPRRRVEVRRRTVTGPDWGSTCPMHSASPPPISPPRGDASGTPEGKK